MYSQTHCNKQIHVTSATLYASAGQHVQEFQIREVHWSLNHLNTKSNFIKKSLNSNNINSPMA